jgi:transcriptional regulator with XRE-family HTH domain
MVRSVYGSKMPKLTRPHSRYAADAAVLLGQLIRKARTEKRMAAEEFANRAGLSRGLLRRIENGDPGCSIGAVFEAAALAGVRLFDFDQKGLTSAIASTNELIALMPKAIHAAKPTARDDF